MNYNKAINNKELEKLILNISSNICAGILIEPCTYPSPGLVNPFNTGSHKDMNILSFMLGSSAICPYIYKFIHIGVDWNGKDDVLVKLRSLGSHCEKNLFNLTGGKNTQRGILFLSGVLSAACGFALKNNNLNLVFIQNSIKNICKDMCKNELFPLQNLNKDYSTLSNGEKLFLKYGSLGIRGELEQGLPSVFQHGYHYFCTCIEDGLGLNLSIIQLLIYYISFIEDSTILWRGNIEGLNFVQNSAKTILNLGGMYSKKGIKETLRAHNNFVDKNLSPGGAADLCSITLALYLILNNNFSLKDILTNYNTLPLQQ